MLLDKCYIFVSEQAALLYTALLFVVVKLK
jgi:hypothetical protein